MEMNTNTDRDMDMGMSMDTDTDMDLICPCLSGCLCPFPCPFPCPCLCSCSCTCAKFILKVTFPALPSSQKLTSLYGSGRSIEICISFVHWTVYSKVVPTSLLWTLYIYIVFFLVLIQIESQIRTRSLTLLSGYKMWF